MAVHVVFHDRVWLCSEMVPFPAKNPRVAAHKNALDVFLQMIMSRGPSASMGKYYGMNLRDVWQ
jgi:hypothetical protein